MCVEICGDSQKFTQNLHEIHPEFTVICRQFTVHAHLFAGNSQAIHRQFTGNSQTIHRRFTGSSQMIHRQFTDNSQEVYGQFTDSSRTFHVHVACGRCQDSGADLSASTYRHITFTCTCTCRCTCDPTCTSGNVSKFCPRRGKT